MIENLPPLQVALAALRAEGSTVNFDRICRSSARWPLFFDVLYHVARLPPSVERDRWLQRLRLPEPLAAVAVAGMERAVTLACEAIASTSTSQRGTGDRTLADQLLVDALRENDPVPSRLARCASVTLPVVLLRRDGPAEGRAFVADLTVWNCPGDGHGPIEFQPAPASFLLHLDRGFLAGQARAVRAVEKQLASPALQTGVTLVWDLQPRECGDGSGSAIGVVGDSASAAFALAALTLLRQLLQPAMRARLHLVDPGRIAVSAGIAADGQSLRPVGGIVSKLRALAELSAANGAAPLLFVAHGQVVPRGFAPRPEACRNVDNLVERAGMLTGGRLDPAQTRVFEALLSEAPGRLDEPTLAAAASASPSSLRGYLIGRWSRWALLEFGRLHLRFVNLALTDLTAQAQPERALDAGRFDSLRALLDANRHVDAFVLTGEPGAGKSTLLQAYELEQCRLSLLALDQGETDLEVCVWVSLADYPSDLVTVSVKARVLREAAGDAAATARAQRLVTPLDWLREHWHRVHPHMPAFDAWARRHRLRLRLLLDGLNEIAAEDRARWRAAVTGLTESIRDAGIPMQAPIFSIRTRENTARLSHPGYVVHQIQVEPWTDRQVRSYCARRLGRAARPLWRRLKRDRALLDLCRLPVNLLAQCELHASGLGRAATGRAELFSGMVWARLRREYAAGRLDTPGLLADADHQALNAERHWAEHLLQLPAAGELIPGLDRQADVMRIQGRQQIELGKAAPWIVPSELREAWLRAVRDLGLAATSIGTTKFAFLHQLFGEFFQARGLTRASGALPPGLAPPPLTNLDDVVATLGAEEMLPGPGVCAVEETFKLAVQLSEEPSRWVAAAAGVNLPLAARAAATCPGRIEPPLLRSLKCSLLARSRDPACDLRLRIEAATELGVLGDDLRYVTDRGHEGEFQLPAPAQWVRVLGGDVLIGDAVNGHARPLMPVTLRPFEMAFAPITNAEYAKFVDARGYEDERWFAGTSAGRWWRGELRNEHMIAFWRPIFEALRSDFDAAVARYFPGEAQGYIDGELRLYASWSPEQAERELERRFGARRIRQPGLWTHPVYGASQPLLPVAGICFFEMVAYCRWLSAQTGSNFRLPTEAEWEVAARGGTGATYPWGDGEPEAKDWLNDDTAHLRRNSPVGVFPKSDTPSGLVDMAGNVAQMTASEYREPPDPAALTTPCLDGEALRASRGGNWSEVVAKCRTTVRTFEHPAHRTLRLGFRIVRTDERVRS